MQESSRSLSQSLSLSEISESEETQTTIGNDTDTDEVGPLPQGRVYDVVGGVVCFREKLAIRR